MHLALGEWTSTHHAVPFVEPFAWTRPGAEWYSASWLPELVYFEILAKIGHIGLRVLNGVISACAFGAVIALARSMRWSRATAVIAALCNVMVLVTLSGMLRPQALLFVLVPLAWTFTTNLVQPGPTWRDVVGLWIVVALAANSHILFPLTAAPLIVIAAEPRILRRKALLATGAVIAGILSSPYVLRWPSVFHFYFSPTPLFSGAIVIGEFTPGFRTHFAVAGIALGAIPWVLPRLELRARVCYGALWLCGLVAFASALRGLLVWWTISLPLIGWSIEPLVHCWRSSVTVLRRVEIGFAIAAFVIWCAFEAVAECPRLGVVA